MPVDKQKQYERQNAWLKERGEQLRVWLLRSTDADIIEHLNQQPNKSGYIKSLIRADMEKHKSE